MDNNYAPEVRTPGKAIACLIMGICSICFAASYGIGAIFAIVGLVLFSKVKQQATEIPKTAGVGRILSIIGLIISILMILFWVVIFALAIMSEM